MFMAGAGTEIAQDSGAQGYVLKSQPFDILTRAIEKVCMSENVFITPGNN